MADPVLKPRPPLDGFHRQFGGVEVTELTDIALVSIATPQGGEAALIDALARAYKADLPAVGQSTVSSDGVTRFLGLQPGQTFAMFTHEGDRAVETVSAKLGDAGYYTDQSDSWVILQLSGAQTRDALERICPIDLHPDAFEGGAVTRTVMEHLGTIILRTGNDEFMLLSARSSAKSFLHAVLTSVENIQ